MSTLALNRNNKNQYRRYPLKQGSSSTSNDGYVLSDKTITGCSISTIYGNHRLYIKQIFYKNNIARITIASFFDDQALGVFLGSVGKDFTTLAFTPFTRFISGSLTVGPAEVWTDITRILNFDKTATELEESIIFCYQPPAVTSLLDKKGNELRGNVNFGVLTNIDKFSVAHGVNFSVTNPDSVLNPTDKSTFLGNCSTPVINNINGVTPFPANVGATANDNNIYLVGVKPIVFFGEQSNTNTATPGTIGIETVGLNIDNLCTQKQKLLPPVDVSGFTLDSLQYKNTYYSKPAMPADNVGTVNYPLHKPERLASNFNATLRQIGRAHV